VKKLAAVFLGFPALAIAVLAGPPMSHAQESQSADDAAWAAARDAGSAEACQQYLEAFPSGQHAEEAFRCLIEGTIEVAPGAGPDVDVY
jgi:hypothetical protein